MSNPINLKSNPNTPAIQQPQANLISLTAMLQTVRQILQSLTGQSGRVTARAVTFDDLIDLGIVQVSNNLASPLVNETANLTITVGDTIIRNVNNLVVSGSATLSGNSYTTTLTIG